MDKKVYRVNHCQTKTREYTVYSLRLISLKIKLKLVGQWTGIRNCAWLHNLACGDSLMPPLDVHMHARGAMEDDEVNGIFYKKKIEHIKATS
jgi:hypothetical protein